MWEVTDPREPCECGGGQRPWSWRARTASSCQRVLVRLRDVRCGALPAQHNVTTHRDARDPSQTRKGSLRVGGVGVRDSLGRFADAATEDATVAFVLSLGGTRGGALYLEARPWANPTND